MEPKTYIDHIVEFFWIYGPKILAAAVLFFGGLWLIRRMTRGFDNVLRHRHLDESLRPFFTSLADTAMKVALLLVVASTVGIQTTSFVAIFSAVAFAIGLALQGSLGNFASGVLILLFRPYRVGDLVTVVDKFGRVVEIQIFSTVLMTPQGKRIIIPNGKITENPIENIAEQSEVQVEVAILVTCDTSLEALREVAEEIALACPWSDKDKHASVQISGISRDDMKAQIAFWTTGAHYEDALSYLYEALRPSCDKAGIGLAKERRKESI